jgi:hypothetical protein
MPRREYDSDLDPPPRRRRPRPRRKRESSTALILVAVGSAILLFASGVAVAAYLILREQPGGGRGVGGTGGSDLERLAGSWESTFRDPAGRVTMHKVKEIVGNTEAATWYQPDGRVFRINRVQFELTTRGPNRVFRYFNGWATDGTGRGGQPFPSGEYVYTLAGDTWTEFEPNGNVIVWTRRK